MPKPKSPAKKTKQPKQPSIEDIVSFLGTVNISGQNYDVIEADASQYSPLEGMEGFSRYDKSVIALDSRLSPERKIDTFVHELLHCMLEASGMCWYFRENFPQVNWHFTEEMLVRTLSPVINATFRNNGFFNVPDYLKQHPRK